MVTPGSGAGAPGITLVGIPCPGYTLDSSHVRNAWGIGTLRCAW